ENRNRGDPYPQGTPPSGLHLVGCDRELQLTRNAIESCIDLDVFLAGAEQGGADIDHVFGIRARRDDGSLRMSDFGLERGTTEVMIEIARAMPEFDGGSKTRAQAGGLTLSKILKNWPMKCRRHVIWHVRHGSEGDLGKSVSGSV
ncbi:MAG: hypothetical protein WBY93_21865, partial [Candidatus Binatus sp.]